VVLLLAVFGEQQKRHDIARKNYKSMQETFRWSDVNSRISATKWWQKSTPDEPEPYIMEGLNAIQRGTYELAILQIEKSRAKCRQQGRDRLEKDATYLLATAKFRLAQRDDEAPQKRRELIEDALQDLPDDDDFDCASPESFVWRKIDQQTGDSYDEHGFLQPIELNREHYIVHLLRGLLLFDTLYKGGELAEFDEAIKVLITADAENRMAQACLMCARIHAATEDYEKVFEYLDKIYETPFISPRDLSFACFLIVGIIDNEEVVNRTEGRDRLGAPGLAQSLDAITQPQEGRSMRASSGNPLTNESTLAAASCYFQIDWVRYGQKLGPTMYFHARYHQEYPPEHGKPYTVFKGQGRGHYVGTVLSSQNGIGHWFGEGDDFFFIDGEEKPSLQGTGTEDYINEAWNMRVHSSLFTGCTVFEPRAPDARVTAYRWHIPDPILFQKSLRFEIERRGFIMNDQGEVITPSGSRPDFWSSVSFWYQETIAEPWCTFPPYGDRVNPEIVLHLPRVVDRIKHSEGVVLEVNAYNRATYTKPWFRARNDEIGSWIEIPFDIEERGKYSMSLFQHLREDNGIWKVLIDGKQIDEAGESHIAGGYRVSLVNQMPRERINRTLDFFNVYRRDEHEDCIYGQRRERKIGLFAFEPGPHRLRLVCVGANPLSVNSETGGPGYNLTADVLSVRKLPFDTMDQWMKKVLEN